MQSKLPENAEHVSVYSKIAPLYDHMMRHVNYVQWYRYVDSLLNTYAPNPHTLLELACGTGKMLEKFADNVPVLLGIDRSFDMLKMAQKRLVGKCQNLLLCNADMRRFAICQPVDVILCLYDSMNYCMTEDELLTALHCAHESLRPDGVFIFDVCTRRTCKKYFNDLQEIDTFADTEFVRQSRYDNKKNWQINEFWVQSRDGSHQGYFERHIQKIYSLKKIKKLVLSQGRWQILGIYHNFTRKSGSERSFRVHYVLGKVS